MGQPISIHSKLCVDVPEHLLTESFSVIRSSGQMDTGWQIAPCDECYGYRHHVQTPSASKHDGKLNGESTGKWRIFMNNGGEKHTDPNTMACGWRRIETIEPTRLSGNQEAIESWRAEVIALLEAKEVLRLEKYGSPEVVREEVKAEADALMAAIIEAHNARDAANNKPV